MISSQGQAPELHVHVDGLHHLARRRTPQVAEWFGEAPANAKACDADRGRRTTATTFHADDDGVLRQDVWYWTTPTQGVRRRPRRRLHGLLRVGQGLDRAQGLSAASPDRPRPRAATVPRRRRGRASCHRLPRAAHPRRPAGARCSAGAGRRGSWSSTSARSGPVRRRVLAARRVHGAGRPASSRSRTSRRSSTTPVYRDDRRCARSAIAAAVTVTDVAARVPDRVLHGQGRHAADARRCSSSRC